MNMKPLIPATFLSLALGIAAQAEPAFHTSGTISLDPSHPNSFQNFAPELPEIQARAAKINTDFGLHVSEIEPGLFFVTDLIYQSAFLVTPEGVVVFDAPPSFGDRLRRAIEATAPDTPITHYVMSHAHSDHNGGGHHLSDIKDLSIIAAKGNEDTIHALHQRGVIAPTQTFDASLNLTIGGVPIELTTAGFHAEDSDTIIYLPDQKFLMAIDTITPGEVPFMNFGATSNIAGYLASFDTFLAYDFEHFLSGHVSVLGTRDDVIMNRDYAFDVRDTVTALMPSLMDRMMVAMEAVQYQHGNIAYRYAMEGIRDECTDQIIARWADKLSVVDVWADSHCETLVVYSVMH